MPFITSLLNTARLILSFITLLCFPLYASAFDSIAKQAILIDAHSGLPLYQKEADQKMYPSSMTKLMSVYIAFDHLKKGVFKLNDPFTVSEQAWKMEGSRTFLNVNQSVPLEVLLNGIIIQSGNDATVALAEGIAGSEEAFAEKMNLMAKTLGLKQSHFVNSTGWPHEDHVMSAHDLALLGKHIIDDFPEYYHYFSKPKYSYNNITQPNRNLLLGGNLGVDGLKTGHTEAGGYGITVSAKQNNTRLIGVVNGLANEAERADEARKLLEYGFRFFTNHTFFKAGQTLDDAPVWNGREKNIPLTVTHDITLMTPKLNTDKIRTEIQYNNPILAPIEKGQEVGILSVYFPNEVTHQFPLIAAADSEELSFMGRMLRQLGL